MLLTVAQAQVPWGNLLSSAAQMSNLQSERLQMQGRKTVKLVWEIWLWQFLIALLDHRLTSEDSEERATARKLNTYALQAGSSSLLCLHWDIRIMIWSVDRERETRSRFETWWNLPETSQLDATTFWFLPPIMIGRRKLDEIWLSQDSETPEAYMHSPETEISLPACLMMTVSLQADTSSQPAS